MLSLLALILLALFPQGDTGQLTGTILDGHNAAIVNANLKLISHSTSQIREIATKESGDFAFTLLPPGRYKLEVTATGFTTVHIDDVRINITQTTSITLNLEPATIQTVVTVDAEAPLVQQESSQMGRVIEGQTIRQLPLPTRNFQQLLTLSPAHRRALQTPRISDAATRSSQLTASAPPATTFASTASTPTPPAQTGRQTSPRLRLTRSRSSSSRPAFTTPHKVVTQAATSRQSPAPAATTITATPTTSFATRPLTQTNSFSNRQDNQNQC
jgi:hypothetical protein